MLGHGFLPIPVGHILSCHAPRMRGIQYSPPESEATTTKNSSSVVTALPAYAGDDSGHYTPNSLL
jgi:hypothetical protein